jgi:prevent-host-death family protein
MMNADVIPSRELRNNYAAIVKRLEERDSVIITNRGKGQAVLINFEDFKGYEEYLHLRYVRERLAEGERLAEDPDTKWLSHDEFWASTGA